MIYYTIIFKVFCKKGIKMTKKKSRDQQLEEINVLLNGENGFVAQTKLMSDNLSQFGKNTDFGKLVSIAKEHIRLRPAYEEALSRIKNFKKSFTGDQFKKIINSENKIESDKNMVFNSIKYIREFLDDCNKAKECFEKNLSGFQDAFSDLIKHYKELERKIPNAKNYSVFKTQYKLCRNTLKAMAESELSKEEQAELGLISGSKAIELKRKEMIRKRLEITEAEISKYCLSCKNAKDYGKFKKILTKLSVIINRKYIDKDMPEDIKDKIVKSLVRITENKEMLKKANEEGKGDEITDTLKDFISKVDKKTADRFFK
jgi:hypothetical protein